MLPGLQYVWAPDIAQFHRGAYYQTLYIYSGRPQHINIILVHRRRRIAFRKANEHQSSTYLFRISPSF